MWRYKFAVTALQKLFFLDLSFGEIIFCCNLVATVNSVKIKLAKIASIQIGYSFRDRLERAESGGIAVIQMKDLVGDFVSTESLLRANVKDFRESHIAQVGDIFFRSRGVKNTCAMLADDPGSAIVAAPLFRIRVYTPSILPEYLNWYINQPPAQAHLGSHVKGTAQKMISKDALETLEVVIPPLERQKAIVELAVLAEQEQRLMVELAEKRKQYMSARLFEIAEGRF
jgi:restriction endonuclease S subunit